MTPRSDRARRPERHRREFRFVPRVINPARVGQVAILAASEAIRASHQVVRAEMPWAEVRVYSSPSALAAIRSEAPAVMVLDDTALTLTDVEAIRRNNPAVAVVLLTAHPLIQCAPPSIARKVCPYTTKADLVFAVDEQECAPERVIAAVVRAAEDHLNIEGGRRPRRFIFLIVDDEPRWFSQFLPVLYGIIGQRASVKLSRTYEEAVTFLFGPDGSAEPADAGAAPGHGDDVVCLITDIYFPRGDNVNSDGGLALVALVKRHYPRIPIIIASKAPEASELKGSGFILPKGDPGSLALLRDYIRDLTGIGDFVVFDERSTEWYRLKDVRDMYGLLRHAGGKAQETERLRGILSAYARQDRFSTWLYMHGLSDLADNLRPERLAGERPVAMLTEQLRREMLRMERTPLVIGRMKVFTLPDLVAALGTLSPHEIQPSSDDDAISSWLDQRGYSELADEVRPIHGRGPGLARAIADAVEKWIALYASRPDRWAQRPDGGDRGSAP